jgi:hypothetical protein
MGRRAATAERLPITGHSGGAKAVKGHAPAAIAKRPVTLPV